MRPTQLLAAAVEIAVLGSRGETYGPILTERARSLIGADGGVTVTRWQFGRAGESVNVEFETDRADQLPTADMVRRGEHYAPRYRGITSMLDAGCAEP